MLLDHPALAAGFVLWAGVLVGVAWVLATVPDIAEAFATLLSTGSREEQRANLRVVWVLLCAWPVLLLLALIIEMHRRVSDDDDDHTPTAW